MLESVKIFITCIIKCKLGECITGAYLFQGVTYSESCIAQLSLVVHVKHYVLHIYQVLHFALPPPSLHAFPLGPSRPPTLPDCHLTCP